MWVYQSVSVSGVDKIKKRVGLHKIGGLKPKNCPPTMFFFMYIFFKEFGMVLFQLQSQICQKMSRIFSPFFGCLETSLGNIEKESNFQLWIFSFLFFKEWGEKGEGGLQTILGNMGKP